MSSEFSRELEQFLLALIRLLKKSHNQEDVDRSEYETADNRVLSRFSFVIDETVREFKDQNEAAILEHVKKRLIELLDKA